MATLKEMVEMLAASNPENKPMRLEFMAKTWWPEAGWINAKPNKHNGGAKTGARVAGAFAGRLVSRGDLKIASFNPKTFVIKK